MLDALDKTGSATVSELESIGATLSETGCCALGDPEDCKNIVTRFENLGVDQILFLRQTARVPHDAVKESIELFGSEIINS